MWTRSMLTVLKMASWRRPAWKSRPRWSRSSAEAFNIAIGLAMLRPVRALPVLRVPGSNTAYCGPIFLPLNSPGPLIFFLYLNLLRFAFKVKNYTSNKSTGQVGDDISIQISHDHDIKLVWFGHQLHAAIINDHIVSFNIGVLLCNLLARLQEKTISQFPVKLI